VDARARACVCMRSARKVTYDLQQRSPDNGF